MKKIKNLFTILLSAVMIFSVFSFGISTTSAASGEILIGCSTGLTGPFAETGERIKKGY
jgi:hypothetical protein